MRNFLLTSRLKSVAQLKANEHHSGRISDGFLTSCWNIDKLRGRTVLSSIVRTFVRSERPDEDVFGDPLPKMQIVGDVALIPLTGVFHRRPAMVQQLASDPTDANDIEEEINQARSTMRTSINGCQWTRARPGKRSAAVPAHCYSATGKTRQQPYCGDGRDLASAGYQAALPASRIYCGPHADGIGCVGTYLAYLDDTEFWTQMGLKWVAQTGSKPGDRRKCSAHPEFSAIFSTESGYVRRSLPPAQ